MILFPTTITSLNPQDFTKKQLGDIHYYRITDDLEGPNSYIHLTVPAGESFTIHASLNAEFNGILSHVRPLRKPTPNAHHQAFLDHYEKIFKGLLPEWRLTGIDVTCDKVKLSYRHQDAESGGAEQLVVHNYFEYAFDLEVSNIQNNRGATRSQIIRISLSRILKLTENNTAMVQNAKIITQLFHAKSPTPQQKILLQDYHHHLSTELRLIDATQSTDDTNDNHRRVHAIYSFGFWQPSGTILPNCIKYLPQPQDGYYHLKL